MYARSDAAMEGSPQKQRSGFEAQSAETQNSLTFSRWPSIAATCAGGAAAPSARRG